MTDFTPTHDILRKPPCTQSNISGESSSSSSSSSNQENTTTSSESQASSLNNQFQKINAALQDNNKRGRIRLLKKGEDFENNLSDNTNGHINSNVDWPTNGHENGNSNGRVHSELFENMGFYKLNKNNRQNNHQNNHQNNDQNHHQNDDQKSPNNNRNDQNLQKEYHLWQDINENAPKTNQNHKSNNPNNHHSNNPSPANCRERRRSKSSFGGDFNPEEEFDFSISNKHCGANFIKLSVLCEMCHTVWPSPSGCLPTRSQQKCQETMLPATENEEFRI